VRKNMCAITLILGVLLEREECKVWKIPSQRSESLLAIWKNVSHLGWQSSPPGLMTIHWCKPSQQAWLAHQGQFICFGHNKWPCWVAYNYGSHKQVSFHCQCSFFFHKCQTMSCRCLIFFFFEGSLRWTMWSHHLFMISSTFNPLEWFNSINSRRSF
jgi:hypothetical protein